MSLLYKDKLISQENNLDKRSVWKLKFIIKYLGDLLLSTGRSDTKWAKVESLILTLFDL